MRRLSFELNRGQFDTDVRYLARQRGYQVFLTNSDTVLVLDSSRVVRMELVGANPRPRLAGLDPLPGTNHYFTGNDVRRWITNIPAYARVAYYDVYPGIDVLYYGQDGQIEYDLVVAPGADPGVIALAFSGIDGLAVTPAGDLQLSIPGGDLRLRAPVVYQHRDGVRDRVACRYVILPTTGSTDGRHRVRLELGAFDPARQLVIDPVLAYSTFLGGSGEDVAFGAATDAEGYVYVTGATASTDFPVAGSLSSKAGGRDVFVTKLDPTGSTIVYSTYLGGNSEDAAAAIAVDVGGNAYVTGSTFSTNFPILNPIQASRAGSVDVFVTKLNPSGVLVASTYFGGTGDDNALGIAVDVPGNVYVTGTTTSTDFPTRSPVQGANAGGVDVFVVKFGPSGSLVYSTYLGGSGDETTQVASPPSVVRIAADAQGNAYVAGDTTSTDFPTTATAFRRNAPGNVDVFLTKLNATGSAIVYSTYLGGSSPDFVGGVFVDAAGHAYVCGTTESSNFPIANALQTVNRLGDRDAFVTKFDPTGSSLVYSTFLGGTGGDSCRSLTGDATGTVYATGVTRSVLFPGAIPNPLQPVSNGALAAYDVFLIKLDRTGSTLLYSTVFGGHGLDGGYAVAVDPAGNAYVTGVTESPTFPVTPGIQDRYGGGASDAFIAKVSPRAGPEILVRLEASGNDTLFSVRLQNLSTRTQVVEWKLWIQSPAVGFATSLLPAAQSFSLPPTPGIDVIVRQPLPRAIPFPGTVVGARLVDSRSGATLSESLCAAVPCH